MRDASGRDIIGMTVLIAIVDVGLTTIFCVASCAFDAFVKTTTLHIVPGIVGAVPAAAIVRETGAKPEASGDGEVA